MNEMKERFSRAVTYVISSGLARSEREIARTIGVSPVSLNMAKTNYRGGHNWDIILAFCDHYPINFWWIRSGEGDMIGSGDRVVALLKKIGELEGQLAHLAKGLAEQG